MTLVRTATDTFVNQVVPAGNYGGTARLWMSNAASAEKLGLIYFKRPFPLGATIVSATLRLTANGAWTGTQTLTAKRIVAKWIEDKVTYNSRPSVTATNAGSVSVVGANDGDPIAIDVSALLADVANGSAFFGFQLSLSTTSVRKVNSSDAADATLRPYLDVTWSMAPDVPTGLAPGGGHVIANTKPVLAWNYADQDGAGTQTSSQVQIATTSTGFGTPEYDSGKVANSQSSWDLSTTAYAGVPLGATRWWRVQVWDDTNLASGWSDPVSFVQTAKGTLTLVSPTGSTVDDLSPPITWSVSGVTQEAYRVFLTSTAKIARRSPILYDTGKVTDGATTSVTIPEGIIVSGGAPFFVTIQVWDTVDRQTIVGDKAYLEVSTANLTYSRSGVPGNVPTLTAVLSPSSSSPGVLLTWTRSAQPDFFCLKVDGVEVLPRIDPTTVFVSGTTYQLLYWGSSPGSLHTYEVEAVVISGGHQQHSSGNATATATPTPNGIWLVDPSDGLAVQIKGPSDSLDMHIGESGVTYEIPGSRAPVRIIDTIRGYEGSIPGTLQSRADRDTFLKLKGRITTLQLIVSDLSIPIVLEEATAQPTQLAGNRLYSCSFSFFQVGSYTFDVSGG